MDRHKRKTKIGSIILEHIKNNAKEYLILLTFFILGVVIGVFFINHTSEIQKQEITSYINTFINSLKENKKIDYIGLLKDSLIKNILLALLLWFIGSTVTLIPIIYGIVAYRGFCLGYTISSAIAIFGAGKGLLFSLSTLLFQNLFFIPALLAIALSGIRLYKSIVKNRRKENIKLEIYKHSIFSLLMTGMLVIASFTEAYISSNLLNTVVQFIWKKLIKSIYNLNVIWYNICSLCKL